MQLPVSGNTLEEIFEIFEPKALASASIGQVHKAKLRNSGEWVVVKVQHPCVDKLLSQDMRLLQQLSWAFGLLERGLNFTSVLDEWQKQAALELDFRYEMANQIRVQEAMKKAGIPIKIPNSYPLYTTQRVMVMEYIDGFKCTDKERLEEHNVNVDELCCLITESFAYQIHMDGLFNGDPHPGNIMVQIDPETGKAIPVLIDWGLVKEFDTDGRIAFARTVGDFSQLIFTRRSSQSLTLTSWGLWKPFKIWVSNSSDRLLRRRRKNVAVIATRVRKTRLFRWTLNCI